MLRKTYRLRLPALIVVPILGFCLIVWRLYVLQIERHDYYSERATSQQRVDIPIRPKRGSILTQDGVELAVSSPAYAVYAETARITSNHHELATQLSVILGGSALDYLNKLRSGRVVTLARKVDLRHKDRLERIKNQFNLDRFALYFVEEGKRHYPQGDLASQIVGYVTIDEYGDNQGLEGIEAAFDDRLRGSLEKYDAARTAIQKHLEPIPEEAYRRAFGDTVVLTIDSAIQRAAADAIEGRCAELTAEGGVAIVYEVKTGRLLGIANYPSFDLNTFGSAPPKARRNRAITDAIEPGSVMKVFTFASLLDSGVITPHTMVDCEGGRARLFGRTITDSSRKMGLVDIGEVIKYSSNIGTIKSADRLDHATFYEYLKRFGLGEAVGIGLRGEVPGLLRPPSSWSGFTPTTLPIGYELQLTALQMVQGVGAIANDGIMMKPCIVESIHDPFGAEVFRSTPERKRRVIGSRAAAEMLSLMEGVLDTHGGSLADIEGYRIGGKTGTAHKFDPKLGTYPPGKYISSFCGIFPLSDPEYLIYIYVDEPHGAKWGSDVAGPIFKEIATEVIRIRGILPDEEMSGAPADVQMKLAASRAKAHDETHDAQLEVVRETISPARAAYESGLAGSETQEEGEEISAAPPEVGIETPNLLGMTMREARRALAELDTEHVVYMGSGRVAQQVPEPGAPLAPHGTLELTFAP